MGHRVSKHRSPEMERVNKPASLKPPGHRRLEHKSSDSAVLLSLRRDLRLEGSSLKASSDFKLSGKHGS